MALAAYSDSTGAQIRAFRVVFDLQTLCQRGVRGAHGDTQTAVVAMCPPQFF